MIAAAAEAVSCAGAVAVMPMWSIIFLLPLEQQPLFQQPVHAFSPFTVCVTWKSTASEQNE
jgi:hypothetical protein